MAHIHLISDVAEVARRRKLVPAGRLAETWPDLGQAGFWVGAESKALLDATGTPLDARLSLDGARVPIYYGPRLRDIESLPLEESLRARVLSARGIAVAWITVNQFGERTEYAPQSPEDPIFYLRRPRGATAHVWRLFRTKQEAIVYTREYFGKDPEALEWAQDLPADDYESLITSGA